MKIRQCCQKLQLKMSGISDTLYMAGCWPDHLGGTNGRHSQLDRMLSSATLRIRDVSFTATDRARRSTSPVYNARGKKTNQQCQSTEGK